MDTPYLVPANADTTIPLGRENMTVGRTRETDLQLDDPMVSRRHARFIRHGSVTELMDLGSSNGTFVNGRRLQGSAQLNDGDSIRFGNLTFTYHAPPAGTAIMPALDAGAKPQQPGGAPLYGPTSSPPATPAPPQYGPTSGPPPPQYGPTSNPPQYAPPPQYGPTSAPPPAYGPTSGPPQYSPTSPPPQYGSTSPPPPQYPGAPPQYTPAQAPPGIPQAPAGQAAIEGPGGPPVPIVSRQTFFGQAPNNDIVVATPGVAPRHALIGAQGSDYYLSDLGSALGTFVNGRRILAPHALQDGDEIRIGPLVFRFRRGFPPR